MKKICLDTVCHRYTHTHTYDAQSDFSHKWFESNNNLIIKESVENIQ